MKRRRFLTIGATAAALAGITWPDRRLVLDWRGSALGAHASIRVVSTDEKQSRRVLQSVVSEVDRLENIFSLYRPHSSLVRLNADGRLTRPPAELVDLMSIAHSLHERTGGAFDMTVQPIFELFASHGGRMPDDAAVERAREHVDSTAVDIGMTEIAFRREGMKATLNGVAQGYITDRITDRLADMGLVDVIVDMGEIRASGTRADGTSWQVGIDGSDRRVALNNRAIATSSPAGTVFEPTGRLHHLFDPATGRPARRAAQTTVTAPTATIADGLSTAACNLDASAFDDLCRMMRAEVTAMMPLTKLQDDRESSV
ncbi:MAG: FAD:protein FMN transferase [Geminicoccaceae bacterium]